MQDITDLMNRYREASRHLWNNYFLDADGDFDRVDRFDVIRFLLFKEIVLGSLGRIAEDAAQRLPSDHFVMEPVAPLGFIQIVPASIVAPLHVNRGPEPTGYWDAEPKEVRTGDAVLELVDCFDWDLRGFRDFEYYRVRIKRCDNWPGVVGRFALIAAVDSRVLAVADPDESGAFT